MGVALAVLIIVGLVACTLDFSPSKQDSMGLEAFNTCGICGGRAHLRVAKAPIYGGHEYFYYHPSCVKQALNEAEKYTHIQVDFALEVDRIKKEASHEVSKR